jgi:itaconate CoA-transferase
LADAKFKTAEARRQNRNELESLIEKLFLEYPSAEWKRRLERARLPYGSVNNIAEVLAHPQLLARHMIQEVASPVGPVPVLATPLRLSDSPQRLDAIPALGEDTESVLRDLGYSDAEIESFRGDRVI